MLISCDPLHPHLSVLITVYKNEIFISTKSIRHIHNKDSLIVESSNSCKYSVKSFTQISFLRYDVCKPKHANMDLCIYSDTELFVEGPRSVGLSLGGTTNWGSNLIVGLTFPLVQELLNEYSFTIFIASGCLLAVFIYRSVFWGCNYFLVKRVQSFGDFGGLMIPSNYARKGTTSVFRMRDLFSSMNRRKQIVLQFCHLTTNTPS